MTRSFSLSVASVLLIFPAAAFAQCVVPDFQLPPANPSETTFELSLDYPSQGQTLDAFSTSTDFRTDWQAYLREVLVYSFEGNLENDFVVQDNAVRGWFHTPWLHAGHSGREYRHGLTRERTSTPGELQEGVDQFFQNWGVGFYNEAAASQLGRIWTNYCNPSKEALQAVVFPEGSVSFKVLFTEASDAEIDALAGAPIWTAHIHPQGVRPGRDPDHERPEVCDITESCPRELRDLTLLQIDVAVKDARAGETGWVFGTFVYDRRVASSDAWDRLRPISIGWGNDPSIIPGGPLAENRINAEFEEVFFGWTGRPHMGWGGRANGPVDNPRSSCVSCHGSAQFPRSDTFGNILSSRLTLADEEMLRVYFRNIESGQLFDPDVLPRFPFSSDLVIPVSLDYSLQTQLGLEQLCFAWIDTTPPFTAEMAKPGICPKEREAAPTAFSVESLALPSAERVLLERMLQEERDLPVSKDAE